MFNFKNISYFILLTSYLLTSCSVQKQIGKSAKADVLRTKALETAHVGISIYDPAAGKYLYNYQGDHYFVPASNTKIPTCYAAMKYLGDSLVGLRYSLDEGELTISATGDPTFMHVDFKSHPVLDFLNKMKDRTMISFTTSNWKDKQWGSGWAWSDYDASYMAERSPFPIYGNVANFSLKGNQISAYPSAFDTCIHYLPGGYPDSADISRGLNDNLFWIKKGRSKFKQIDIPFQTKTYDVSLLLLGDLIKTNRPVYKLSDYLIKSFSYQTIHSQPTDSVLKPMMHRSDNFFAEQMLLMVSNEKLGVMNDEAIIDTLLKTDFKDLPQKPRWADGSGLSRYNLFSPQDMVAILKKMKDEFGMERIKTVFPTGGEGTISSYYKNEAGFIYGKTGTLSGVVAFSGFLYTKKGKLLIFSTLVNNHNESATDVRRAIEKFLVGVRDNF